jgi:hypothetical protein
MADAIAVVVDDKFDKGLTDNAETFSEPQQFRHRWLPGS